MSEKLSPERAVRLLRAKVGELENRVLLIEELREAGSEPVYIAATEFKFIVADIALIAGLLADHIEEAERRSEWTLTTIAEINRILGETVATIRALNDKLERHE